MTEPHSQEANSYNRFDWRRHIVLSSEFSDAERTALSSTLDEIAHAFNAQGQELIINAALRNGGQILITPGASTVYDDTKSRIEISFEQAQRVLYEENGEWRRVSLNGILVHELFHAGDPNPSPARVMEYGNNQLAALLIQHHYTPAEIQAVQQELAQLLTQRTGRNFIHGLITQELGRVLHTVSLENQGFPELARMMGTIPPERFEQSLIASHLIERAGELPWETRAVEFTDAFMRMNHGTDEPQRVNQHNGSLSETAQPLIILQRLDEPAAYGTYRDALPPYDRQRPLRDLPSRN